MNTALRMKIAPMSNPDPTTIRTDALCPSGIIGVLAVGVLCVTTLVMVVSTYISGVVLDLGKEVSPG
jgi:hypothetical protein